MKCLYLYGPPASGKTTRARRLADEFGVEAVDLDAVIVGKIGRPIAQFFAEKGEAAFRALERETLREVTAPVIALGGGTLLDPDNRAFAEAHGFVAVLEADDETIARRIAAQAGTRPLGNKLAERRAHYAGFAHHVGEDTRILLPAHLAGAVRVPVSKSHLHRLLIAEFLAARTKAAPSQSSPDSAARSVNAPYQVAECADIAATRRCLDALANCQTVKPSSRQTDARETCVLDCGESGSTLRFLAPVAAALGVKAEFVRRGRLAERPMLDYSTLASGEHVLRGDVSSQFVTGLLFALPLLAGDSVIRFSTPLQSRGYVDMTLDVVRAYGIRVEETDAGFRIPGDQRYVAPPGGVTPEGDWSGAAFWFAANALGAAVRVEGVGAASRQPDRVVGKLIETIRAGGTVDVSDCPDNYPALAVVNHALGGRARFVGTERLRLKESDRLAAMEAVFANPCDVDSRNDHRIAMAAAIAATRADGPVLIHGASCVAKSYPGFFDDYLRLAREGRAA